MIYKYWKTISKLNKKNVSYITQIITLHILFFNFDKLNMLMRNSYHLNDKTLNEPVHEISNRVVCATSKASYAQSDQSLC